MHLHLHLHLSRSQRPLWCHRRGNPLPPFYFVFSFSYGVAKLQPCMAGVKRHLCALDYFATTWAGVNAPYLRAGSTSRSDSEGDCCLHSRAWWIPRFPSSFNAYYAGYQPYIHCSIWTTVLFVFCSLQINKQGNEGSLKRQTITTCLVIIRA